MATMEVARSFLINRSRAAKTDLIDLMNGTSRDWILVQNTFQTYVDCQMAADVLAGYTEVPKYKP